MLKSYQACDRCDKPCEWDSIYAVVDAEGGIDCDEQRTEPVDLCPWCMMAVMRKMVERMTPEDAATWVKTAREKPKPIRL